jgi:hypothetical protein
MDFRVLIYSQHFRNCEDVRKNHEDMCGIILYYPEFGVTYTIVGTGIAQSV